MATLDFNRKFTVLLSADVKEYSGMMGEDEEVTIINDVFHGFAFYRL